MKEKIGNIDVLRDEVKAMKDTVEKDKAKLEVSIICSLTHHLLFLL